MYLVYGGKRVGGFNNANYDLHTVGMLISRNVTLTRLSVQQLKTFSSERRGLVCHPRKEEHGHFRRVLIARRRGVAIGALVGRAPRAPTIRAFHRGESHSGRTTPQSLRSSPRPEGARIVGGERARSARCFPNASSDVRLCEPVADGGPMETERSEEEMTTAETTREAPSRNL